MSKAIRQKVTLNMTPHKAYEMLMDSGKHTKLTGAKARISRKVGGKFTAYDGYCEGVNLQIVPDKKIVQTWRAQDWPKNHYSVATFLFSKTKTGTLLSFIQKDVPDNQYKEIKEGWQEFYWDRMT